LVEQYNDQLREIRASGLADTEAAAALRDMLRALRDQPRAVDATVKVGACFGHAEFSCFMKTENIRIAYDHICHQTTHLAKPASDMRTCMMDMFR
jgi:hypothetical protein